MDDTDDIYKLAELYQRARSGDRGAKDEFTALVRSGDPDAIHIAVATLTTAAVVFGDDAMSFDRETRTVSVRIPRPVRRPLGSDTDASRT